MGERMGIALGKDIDGIPTQEERQEMARRAWEDWWENVVKKYLLKME